MNLMSPSDIVGPSPVTSNGTETTEIEDEEAEEPHTGHRSIQPQLKMLATNLPDNLRQSGGDEAVSVIHAPESFRSWVSDDADIQHMSNVSKFQADVKRPQPIHLPSPSS